MVNITGTSVSETLEGGVDDDRIEDSEGGADILRGNGGNDTLIVTRLSSMAAGAIGIEGGDGDDVVTYHVYNGSLGLVDGGSGNDRIEIDGAGGSVTITTGSGVPVSIRL
jgi:hypothetical protein